MGKTVRVDYKGGDLFEIAVRQHLLRVARVGDIRLSIELTDAIPDDHRAALLAVASYCTVHNQSRGAASGDETTCSVRLPEVIEAKPEVP